MLFRVEGVFLINSLRKKWCIGLLSRQSGWEVPARISFSFWELISSLFPCPLFNEWGSSSSLGTSKIQGWFYGCFCISRWRLSHSIALSSKPLELSLPGEQPTLTTCTETNIFWGSSLCDAGNGPLASDWTWNQGEIIQVLFASYYKIWDWDLPQFVKVLRNLLNLCKWHLRRESYMSRLRKWYCSLSIYLFLRKYTHAHHLLSSSIKLQKKTMAVKSFQAAWLTHLWHSQNRWGHIHFSAWNHSSPVPQTLWQKWSSSTISLIKLPSLRFCFRSIHPGPHGCLHVKMS